MGQKIRVLVVDDEAPARAKLRKLVAGAPGFELVGEAADGEVAVEAIRQKSPDLVFLDVQMPRKDGFEVVEAVGVDAMPWVVFVTAFDEHALRAFEVHALDYLLKPFGRQRFEAVLERIWRRWEKDSAAELAQRLEQVLAAVSPPPPLQEFSRRVRVRHLGNREREVLLPVEEIHFIRSKGNYLHFHTGRGTFDRRGTLNGLLECLDPEHFVRINRSEIVRLDAILELQPFFHGDTYVLLPDSVRLTWTRRYRDRIPDL